MTLIVFLCDWMDCSTTSVNKLELIDLATA